MDLLLIQWNCRSTSISHGSVLALIDKGQLLVSESQSTKQQTNTIVDTTTISHLLIIIRCCVHPSKNNTQSILDSCGEEGMM